MNSDYLRDPFTRAVIRNLDPEARSSLTPRQLEALQAALYKSRPMQKHPVDVRGVIPLFFVRLYFVFLMGRDRRVSAREVEHERRRRGKLLGGVLLFLVAMSPVILLIAIVLIALKNAFGIDIGGDDLWHKLKALFGG